MTPYPKGASVKDVTRDTGGVGSTRSVTFREGDVTYRGGGLRLSVTMDVFLSINASKPGVGLRVVVVQSAEHPTLNCNAGGSSPAQDDFRLFRFVSVVLTKLRSYFHDLCFQVFVGLHESRNAIILRAGRLRYRVSRR